METKENPEKLKKKIEKVTKRSWKDFLKNFFKGDPWKKKNDSEK